MGAGLLLVAALVVVAKLNSTSVKAAQTPPAASRPSAAAQSVATPTVPGQITSGVWLVGTDVQPGTYRTPGPATGETYCFWSRHSSASGGLLDDIIASDGAQPGHQMVVTIAATDVLFRTNDCAPFVKVG